MCWTLIWQGNYCFLLYDDLKMGTILYICSTVTAKVIFPLKTLQQALPTYIKYVSSIDKKICQFINKNISVNVSFYYFWKFSIIANDAWVLWHCSPYGELSLHRHGNACITTYSLMKQGKEIEKLFIPSTGSCCVMPDVKPLMFLPSSQDHVMIYLNSDNQEYVIFLKSSSSRLSSRWIEIYLFK